MNKMETTDTPVITSLHQSDKKEMQSENNIESITEVEDLMTLLGIERGKEIKLIDTPLEDSLNPKYLPVDIQKEEAAMFDVSETVKTSEDNVCGDSGEFVLSMLTRGKLEEQGVCTKRISSPLSETPLETSSHWDEDVTAENWRQHRKHVFVLSEAGKPIYSRYGSEEALSSTMGVMMALVSFIQSGDNSIRSVYSGIEINFTPSINPTIINILLKKKTGMEAIFLNYSRNNVIGS